MNDEVRVNSIRKSCKEKILNIPSLRITFINEINDFILKKSSKRYSQHRKFRNCFSQGQEI